MRKTTFIISCILLLATLMPAQSNISGIINQYQSVFAIDTCLSQLTLDNASGLQEGMKVLVIQMKGANIDENNTSSFGNILNLNQAGNFEKGEIETIDGSSIFLKHKLIHQYSTSGQVQIVSIPQYEDATVVGSLEAQAWDGATGGVLIFEVSGILTVNAPITTTGQGLRGGEIIDVSPNNCEWFLNPSSYHYGLDNWRGSRKGEGIAAFITDKEAGRGAQANGGGGGNDHNAGGGGGANVRAGGKGGRNEEPSNFGCRGLNPGIGGKAINAASNKIFLGGGGGAGHTNNNLGTNGGNGGGIIIITANSIQGNNNSLTANGADVNSNALGDGAGGGGGGGTIILNATTINELQIEAKGGQGGTIDNGLNPRCMGPGGGGSGGRIFVDNNNLSASPVNLNGGDFGLSVNSSSCSDSPNSAESGVDGIQELPSLITQGIVDIHLTEITTQPSLPTACVGDTLVLQIEAIGNDLNYQWQIETMNGFENIVESADYMGVASTNLSILNTNLSQNGSRIRCLVSNDCFDPKISEEVILELETIPVATFSYSVNDELVQFTNQSTNADTYTWDFGDNSTLVNTESPSHEYLQNGEYEVTLIATNDCGSDTITDFINIMIVALQELQGNLVFEIYPNPAKDFLVIDLPEAFNDEINIRLLGVDGKILIDKKITLFSATQFRIKLHEFPAGLYAIQLLTHQGIATRKFVKF